MKLNLSQTQGFTAHRSGWAYCLNSLQTYHSNSGLFVCDFIERQFSWELWTYYHSLNTNKIPYRFPWVGFLHNPHNMPEWFDSFNTPQAIFARPEFQESLQRCRALITLSDYLADWVRSQTDIPVISVKHPTGPAPQWSPYRFLKQDIKHLVQVGYWLRRMESIMEVKVPPGYQKVWLPSNKEKAYEILHYNKLVSRMSTHLRDHLWHSVNVLDHLSNQDFDDLYARSVIFLDLHDASANNAVVEAVARHTPIIVNRHPAVQEYLGADYPLYFTSLGEVYDILKDSNRIIEAHHYLKRMDKPWISGNYFAYDIKQKLENVL